MATDHKGNNAINNSISLEMLELNADELGQVAGGASPHYYMAPLKVTGQRPQQQQVRLGLTFSM